jgi:hypothetical protein
MTSAGRSAGGTPRRPAARRRAAAARPVLRRAVTGAAALAATVLAAAGCSSPAARRPAPPASRPVSLPLITSVAASQTTWAVVPMGAASGPNLFWELFALPARAARWRLATPPDVATNGAIALSVQGQSLVAGIHPSLLLRFSPITSTSDNGQNWATGAPDPGLASVPDALAIAPDATRLVALDRNGGADVATIRPSAGGDGIIGPSGWKTLVSVRALAATAAARPCRLTALTATAFGSSGVPLLAGNCAAPGVAGIFALAGGRWRAAGPALPAPLRHQRVRVLRLVRTGTRLIALLQAGTGRSASLVSAWAQEPAGAGGAIVAAARSGGGWALSPPLRLAGRTVTSSSFGRYGTAAVTLARLRESGQHGEYISGSDALWHALPALPAGHAVALARPADGSVYVLAADGSTLTAWQLRRGTRWVRTQSSKVPIEYGSSS